MAISKAATPKSAMLGVWLDDRCPPINHGRLLELVPKTGRQDPVARASSEALGVLLRFDQEFGIRHTGRPGNSSSEAKAGMWAWTEKSERTWCSP